MRKFGTQHLGQAEARSEEPRADAPEAPQEVSVPLSADELGTRHITPPAEAVRAEGVPMGGNWIGKPLYMFESLAEQITYGDSHFPFRSPYVSHPVSYGPGLCPRAERAMAQLRTLPINERYTQEDVEDIAQAVHKVAEAYLARAK